MKIKIGNQKRIRKYWNLMNDFFFEKDCKKFQILNFGKKTSKFWAKFEIMGKIRNFGNKSKFWEKIEILGKNLNFWEKI